ncbi:MAG: hypothetical protein ACXW14_09090 [Burkholderiaceae bacterium]|jgi:hypothetical protein
MTGFFVKGLGFFLAAAVVSALLTWIVPGRIVPAVKVLVWLLPLVFLGIEFLAIQASHDLSWAAAWRGAVSAGAQTLIFLPGALAGHYGVAALRADLQGPRGNTF